MLVDVRPTIRTLQRVVVPGPAVSGEAVDSLAGQEWETKTYPDNMRQDGDMICFASVPRDASSAVGVQRLPLVPATGLLFEHLGVAEVLGVHWMN